MTPSQSRQPFERTHWSMAMHVDASQTAHAALVELCVRYWYPIYAYLRRFGHGPETAQGMTRSFLQHLFQHFRDSGIAPAQGRFRNYLLARLRAFLAGDWPCAAADAVIIPELAEPPPDLELRNQRDNVRVQSPEQAFQQSFALELLARALASLREEARQTRRLDMFEALEPFLAVDPTSTESDELARRLRTRTISVVMAIKRLRQRFRELIDSELADTVVSADELLAEQQALYAVLCERG